MQSHGFGLFREPKYRYRDAGLVVDILQIDCGGVVRFCGVAFDRKNAFIVNEFRDILTLIDEFVNNFAVSAPVGRKLDQDRRIFGFCRFDQRGVVVLPVH